MDITIRDHFVYASSQWETTLQCNVVSHWLDAYTKWSLHNECWVAKITIHFGLFITCAVCAIFIFLNSHCGLVIDTSEILVNIGSGNGLSPYTTKALPESMVTYDLQYSVVFSQGITNTPNNLTEWLTTISLIQEMYMYMTTIQKK